MFDKPKRKNRELLLTRYDVGWDYAVCRWMRWSNTKQMIIEASPEICMTHLMQLKHAEWRPWDTRYKYTSSLEVFPLRRGDGYEFQAKLSEVGHGSYTESVNGLIIDDGSGYSLITLRMYNQTPFLFVTVIVGLLLYSVINPAAMLCVAGGVVITLPLLLIYSLADLNNSASLRIATHLQQLPRLLAPGQTELTPKQIRRIRRNIRKHDPYVQ